jgi:hypothetical protein
MPELEEGEKGGICSKDRGNEKLYNIVLGKPERKLLLGILKHTCEVRKKVKFPMCLIS